MATIDEKRIKVKRLRLQKLRAEKAAKPEIHPQATPEAQAELQKKFEAKKQANIAAKRKEEYMSEPWAKRLMLSAGHPALALAGVPLRMMGKGEGVQDILAAHSEASTGDPASTAGQTLGDLSLLAIPGTQATKAMRGAKTLARLGKAGKAAVIGAIEGAGAAGVHQLQNIGAGREFSPDEAALETGISAALPGVGTVAGKALKNRATKVIQTVTKLGKKIKGQKTMTDKQAQRFFDLYGSWRGIEASAEKISEHHSALSNQFDDLINNIAAGKQVNLKYALNDLRKDIAAKAKTAEVSLEDLPSLNKKIDDFEEMIEPLTDKAGRVSFKLAQNFKRHTLDPMASWDKPTPLGMHDPSLTGKAQAARGARGQIRERMAAQEPEFAPLNQQFKQMAEIKPFIDKAIERQAANRGLSLQDLMTLAPGLIGAGGAAYMDKPEYAALGMLPFLLSRGQKSPGFAATLYGVGKRMETPTLLKDYLMRGGRSAAFGGGQ